MPLHTIPALPEEYPLYDWQEYQSSRDALVSGSPTRYFAKEAWNAIVDSLNDALKAAGLKWDATYTTASGAKIAEAYGKLTAQKFNSVRHNIDWPAPLGWAWADREDFRGYVGREDFNGRSTHGRACDKVYPEYIIELVRKLNFLLEIMRGTVPMLETEASHMASTPCRAEVLDGKAALVAAEYLNWIDIKADAIVGRSAQADKSILLSTEIKADAVAGFATQGCANRNTPLKISASGRSMPAAFHEARYLAPAKASVEAIASMTVDSASDLQIHTYVLTEGVAHQAVDTQAEASASVNTSAEPIEQPALDFSGSLVAGTAVHAEPERLEGIPLECAQKTATKIIAEPAKNSRSALVRAACKIGTNISCALDTAWYPPIWVNGGLWIRQSQSVTKNENGELVIT